ncbi:MAG: hypothetical protein ACI4SS_03130 [Clostridia bacterium]
MKGYYAEIYNENPNAMLDKLHYIAAFEGRSANKQFEQLVKKCICDFEREHGEITNELITEMYKNS